MKTKFFITFVILSFLACDNDDDAEEVQNRFFWNQTQCDDPWILSSNNPDEETEIAIETFLDQEGVNVLDINFISDPSLVQICSACSCTSGKIIAVDVDEMDSSKMLELGFYQ